MQILDTNDIRQLLAAKCKEAGSQAAWAKAHSVSGQYVSDVLAGRREPGDAVLAGLGLVKQVGYVAKE